MSGRLDALRRGFARPPFRRFRDGLVKTAWHLDPQLTALSREMPTGRMSVKSLKGEAINGWFTPAECRRLYSLIMTTAGAVLEIGHFVGRSTACICEALHDSRKAREFRSYDLGFKSSEEFKRFYNPILGTDVPVPSLQAQVFARATTTTDLALLNLSQVGLEKYVTLICGNFIELDHHKYECIFCDALHEPSEIVVNLPHIVERSNPGCIWAFHDMTETNIEAVLAAARASLVDVTDSLAVFLYNGQ